MTSNTPVAKTESAPSPYRVRKRGTTCQLTRSLPSGVALLGRSGDQERSQRWMTTKRVLEEFGEPCDSPIELGVVAEVADVDDFVAPALMSTDRDHEQLGQLCELVKQTAAVSARIAVGAQELELRTLCFALARTCQLAQSRIRKQQLWSVERRL